jgi:prephenate dehydratase
MPASASGTHTTLVFELPHRPGSLVTVLQALSRQGLNLTRIGSRPIAGRLSEYSFMIEFEGDPARGEVAKALGTIRKIAPLCEVLGTYRLRKV